MYKCVLLDLDGTLTNTNSNSYEAIKYGREGFSPNQIPLIDGALEFLKSLLVQGFVPVVVSDSHYKFVPVVVKKRFSDELNFDIPCISLADKPNVEKAKAELDPIFKSHGLDVSDCIMVGDTCKDVEFARSLGIPSVLCSLECADKSEDKFVGYGWKYDHQGSGPTYTVKNYQELLSILQDPRGNLYPVEQLKTGVITPNSVCRPIKIDSTKRQSGGYSFIRALGRQAEGACDEYGVAQLYKQFQGSGPAQSEISRQIGSVLGEYLQFTQGAPLPYDFFKDFVLTCVPDKSSTQPPNKMQNLMESIKVQNAVYEPKLFSWVENEIGTIRNHKTKIDRLEFIKRRLQFNTNEKTKIAGKNVIMIDDQLTTGATAEACIQMLNENGAVNIMFLVPFFMTTEVSIKKCPHCHKPMKLRYRRKDQKPFFSCPNSQWGGDGCGYIEDFS